MYTVWLYIQKHVNKKILGLVLYFPLGMEYVMVENLFSISIYFSLYTGCIFK